MEGLTIEQEQEYQRDKKARAYLATNQTVVDSYLPLKNKQTTFIGNISALELLATGKVIETSGETEVKTNKKGDVGTFYEGVCGVCRAFLVDKGDLLMANNFNVTKAKITKMKDGNVILKIGQINTWITDVLIPDAAFATYGVTAGTVTAGAALLTAFDAELGQVGAIDSGKEAAATDVELKVDDLRKDIAALELLVKHFITSNVSFYNGFKSAIVIDDIGVHHTGIQGEVEKAGEIVEDATITCAELNKTAHTNLLGHYEIPKMKPGLHKFVCSSPTAGTQSRVVLVKKGKTIEVDWDLGDTSGGGGVTIIRQGDLGSTVSTSVNITDLNPTAASTAKIEVTDTCQVWAAANVTDPPSPSAITVTAATPYNDLLLTLATAIGLDSSKPLLLIKNNGAGNTHYKFTFGNV